MQARFFSLLLAGATLAAIPVQSIMANDGSTTGPTSLSSGTNPSGKHGKGFKRLKAALAQVGLNAKQDAEIKRIFATGTSRKEIRREIMAVLTKDQRVELKALLHKHKHKA